jgi:hypothetical protein
MKFIVLAGNIYGRGLGVVPDAKEAGYGVMVLLICVIVGTLLTMYTIMDK